MPQVSVLICTYNRHQLLERALRALLDGTREKPDQVVVVNGGDERGDRVVESLRGRPGVELKLVKTPNKNLAASRNVGLPHCTGQIVAMTDDDAEVLPDWISRIKETHQRHPEAGAVGGPVLDARPEAFVDQVAGAITFPFREQGGTVRTLPGVNIAYKREALAAIGAQDESLFRGEDVDFNWRVQKAGYTVYYDPGIRVRHHHRPSVAALLRQHYMYGRAYYLVRRKWPDMYCVYPHGIHRFRDILKAGHFFIAPFYEPFLSARRIPSWPNRALALPIFFLASLCWRSGMIRQGVLRSSEGG